MHDDKGYIISKPFAILKGLSIWDINQYNTYLFQCKIHLWFLLGVPNTANVAVFKDASHSSALDAALLVNGEHYANPVGVSTGYWWAVDLVHSYRIGTITVHSGGGKYMKDIFRIITSS